jgi:hypothetical protein
MLEILLTILLALAPAPVQTDTLACHWKDPVQTVGTSDHFRYDHSVTYYDPLDQCACAPTHYILTIVDIGADLTFDVWADGGLIADDAHAIPMPCQWSDPVVYECADDVFITLRFMFCQPLSAYAVGDTWEWDFND